MNLLRMLLSLTVLKLPYPVWETSSAAPPMGLVKTPTMPFPTPEITPLALLPAELCISQFLWKFCMGWSTMPAIAPDREKEKVSFLNSPKENFNKIQNTQ